jgi:hypothetical protein
MALNILVWGGLSWMGAGLLEGAASQDLAGYPNAGQIIYYLTLPLLILALSLGRPLWRLRKQRDNLGVGTLCATLALLPVYLFPYTGGV